jgi:OmpA-OmpF porin, OOP family
LALNKKIIQKNNFMAIKKYTLLVAVLVMLQIAGNAQTKTDWGWDWKDSSKVPTKSVPQYNEFLNNQFPYPVKPKNQWELGVSVGFSQVGGDLTSKLGLGASISARKSLSHVFSLRPILTINRATGSGWADDYQTNVTTLGIDGIASLNTIRNYSGNPKTNIYVLAGVAVMGANVKTRVGNSGGYPTDFRPRNTDNLITTLGTKVNGVGTTSVLPVLTLGAGIAFKINDKINLAFEAKNSLSNYDYLDAASAPMSNAFDALWYQSVRLNINLGKKAKRVQPLNWINPNNYVYNELNSPKHMKMPKVVLVDADKDGVTDQFDLEPNTPAGAAVDSHGVAKDSDSDGVPDYKDKELLTSQKCFPVNADGIGNCPEPSCCKEMKDELSKIKEEGGFGKLGANGTVCNIGSLPSVQFKKGAALNKDAETVLASAAAQLKANSDCKVKVVGYVGNATASKAAQQLSYDRVSAVIKYLVEKQGISESRLLFFYGENGDANTVDLLGTTEDGPNTVPAPHPNLRSK